jgi:uncharacterized protein
MTMRVVALLALSVSMLGGCGRGPHDSRGLARNEVLLRVSATGDSETRPDLATFSAGVSSIGVTSVAATAANNAKMNAVMAAVEGLGVKRDDTQTQGLSVNRIDYGRNRGQYEASNTVSVKVRKIDTAGQAIGAATAAGANIVSGPNLTVDDREAANLSAYAAAYKAARARADTYAKAAGLKVERIISITDGSATEEPMYAAEAMNMPPVVRQTSAPPIRAGMNSSTATVSVAFALRPL